MSPTVVFGILAGLWFLALLLIVDDREDDRDGIDDDYEGDYEDEPHSVMRRLYEGTFFERDKED